MLFVAPQSPVFSGTCALCLNFLCFEVEECTEDEVLRKPQVRQYSSRCWLVTLSLSDSYSSFFASRFCLLRTLVLKDINELHCYITYTRNEFIEYGYSSFFFCLSLLSARTLRSVKNMNELRNAMADCTLLYI